MTFDEVLDEMNANQEPSESIRLMERLRDTYAPTIEMTKLQYDFITSGYEQENISDAVANISVDEYVKESFHSEFWAPLTQREVVMAWLHPETIKIVDE